MTINFNAPAAKRSLRWVITASVNIVLLIALILATAMVVWHSRSNATQALLDRIESTLAPLEPALAQAIQFSDGGTIEYLLNGLKKDADFLVAGIIVKDTTIRSKSGRTEEIRNAADLAQFNSWMGGSPSAALGGRSQTIQMDEGGLTTILSLSPPLSPGQTVGVLVVRHETNRLKEALKKEAWALAFGSLIIMLFVNGVLGYVLWLLTKPMTVLSNATALLAKGQTDVVVPAQSRRDEVGDIARAVEVFRLAMIERERLVSEAGERQKIKLQHARHLESSIDGFRQDIGFAVNGIGGHVGSLSEAATSLTRSVGETQKTASLTLSELQEVLLNVDHIAAGTEELAQAVMSIESQLSQAAHAVETADGVAIEARGAIEDLSEKAKEIGDVVTLIRAIAGQTNLLALNATIEAARAGDYGRGFAVVAQEVKSLSLQTQKATDLIAEQISAVQASTQTAMISANAFADVSATMRATTSEVVAMINQHNASTSSISERLTITATQASVLSRRVEELEETISRTGEAANLIREVSDDMANRSGNLDQTVDGFLKQVAV
jgi:methyl-accepting chemotaxis protein